jgi:translation initiation factor 1A
MVLSESHLKELVLPQPGELFGRVIRLAGGDTIIVKCIDGKVMTIVSAVKLGEE